jgi:hypothetical protein
MTLKDRNGDVLMMCGDAPLPPDQWFGKEPALKKKKEVFTHEQRAAAKAAVVETSYEPPEGILPDEEWYRHLNWRDKRAKVRTALAAANASQSAIQSFDNCGSCCQVEWNATEQRYRVVGCYCHSRHCEPCMKAKASLIINNLRARMADRKPGSFHFITLTLKHTGRPLKDEIKRLYASYKKLRETDEWIYGQINADKIFAASRRGVKHSEAIKHVSKKGQLGGAATLEVTWNAEKREWHPHLHIISEGSQVTNHRLKDLWFRITKDSWECDCRPISADKDVAYYVGKYVTKGTNAEVWDDLEVAKEWVTAIKGVRMCATFGTWRGYRLLDRPKEVPGQWQHVCSLASLVRRFEAGEEHARLLLIALIDTQQYNPHRKRSPKPK